MSDSIKELIGALSKAQIAFLPIKKSEDVDYQTTKGRKHYSYAPLSNVIESVKKALSDNGLAVIQTTRLEGDSVILETCLCHISGEYKTSEMYVGRFDEPPQDEGSALTYKRRYGISAILNVSSEDDDDGEAATTASEARPIAVRAATPKQGSQDAPMTRTEAVVRSNEHYCQEHKTPFILHKDKTGQQWYSHIKADKTWCNEQVAKTTPVSNEVFAKALEQVAKTATLPVYDETDSDDDIPF